MTTSVRARQAPGVPGRSGSSNPGGPSGGGGWHSSAGIYYPYQNGLGGGAGTLFTASTPFGTVAVTNNVWNPITGWQQTTFAASLSEYITIADIPAGNGPVVSYPSSGWTTMNTPGSPATALNLRDITVFTSAYNEVQPEAAGVASEAGYDLWFNNYSNEVMFQTDMVDPNGLRGGIQIIDVQTFGGNNGIPAHTWNLTVFGNEIIWQLADSGVVVIPASVNGGLQAMTVDGRAMINWLADRGYLESSLLASTATAFGFGWEISSTNGLPMLYRMNGLSWNITYSPMASSPGLELSGFPVSGPGPYDTINSVTVSVTEYQSDLTAQPCTIQLWDFSGSGVQVGPTKIGARSTSASNVSQATFYGGLTPASLPALRVRLYGNAATTLAENVGGVALSVNYTPGQAPASSAASPARPVMTNRAVTVPVRIG